ncbi:hypothetical protein [Nostoc parmelioides]|uniref:hypothetical protein n=1 Tax=Nostoc parmelioides TaxID=1521621 RepID=UPI0024111791|nr:hypothetical protein [Nostoc parmelioides]
MVNGELIPVSLRTGQHGAIVGFLNNSFRDEIRHQKFRLDFSTNGYWCSFSSCREMGYIKSSRYSCDSISSMARFEKPRSSD